jgi:hypothetical protein
MSNQTNSRNDQVLTRKLIDVVDTESQRARWRDDARLRKEMAKRPALYGHQHGRPRLKRPRKLARPPKRLTDCDLCVLAHMVEVFPKWRYSADLAVILGFPVSEIETALHRLYSLGVVASRVHCDGYRPYDWRGKPGKGGLGASPAVKQLLAEYLEARVGGNVAASENGNT